MILIKNLRFNNIMSYGEDNVLHFNARVTQLVGKNGAGKSSIPIVLEELFYNKNSRGIPKSEIRNRFIDKKEYSMSSEFHVDKDVYLITKIVRSTAKVVLIKNGVDISGHTATQTYKMLEGILGMDFLTFTKLVYQSIDSSLDFLKATDANRKKFLVSLLGLEKYIDAETQVKEAATAAKKELAKIQGKVDTTAAWIAKNEIIPDSKTLEELPEELDSSDLESKIASSGSIRLSNQAARVALENKQALDKLLDNPVEEAEDVSEELAIARTANNEANRVLMDERVRLQTASKEVSTIEAIEDRCHSCKQTLDVGNKVEMLERAKLQQENYNKNISRFFEESEITGAGFLNKEVLQAKYARYTKYKTNRSSAESKYDSTEPTQILDASQVLAEITKLKTNINSRKNDIKKAQEHNQTVAAHNAAIEFQIKQLEGFEKELETLSLELEDTQVEVARVGVLVKALGGKGLIAYKIESMVKLFEGLINEYLQVLSDGAFNLTFSVEDSKLLLTVYDSGIPIKMNSLSSGEFNKVNTATLLAVRKMMCSLSKVDINVLYVDEVMSVLDEQSKDTLIEILLEENNLNTIVVSHGYNHPLAGIINVVKTNKISELINEN